MSLEIVLKRLRFTDTYTEGELWINHTFFCNTIEDKNRDIDKDGKLDEEKVYGKTCIPYGIYEVINSFSNHFQKILPEVLKVPGFSGVRIHSGNTADDSLGCIIIGKKVSPGIVSSGRPLQADLVEKIKIARATGEKCWLIIK